MQISKIFLTVFLCGFLLFGFLYVYNSIQYGKKKAVWEAEVEKLDKDIAENQLKIKFHEEEAEKWQDAANAEETKRRDMEEKLIESRAAHARDLAKIQELAPDELVSELRRRLQVPDSAITLTEMGVQFTLEATQLVLDRVQKHDFHLAVEFPARDKLQLSQSNEISNLKGVIIEKDGTISTLIKDRDDWMKKYNGEHKLRIDAESSFNLFSTKNLVVGGVVGAAIVALSFLLN